MIDDVLDLLEKQPRIDGIDDRAHARYRKIQLEVPVRIPRQRSYARRSRDAERAEHIRQLARAPMRVSIGVAMNLSRSKPGDDCGIAVVRIRMAQQRRDQKRHLHHVAVHWFLPASCWR